LLFIYYSLYHLQILHDFFRGDVLLWDGYLMQMESHEMFFFQEYFYKMAWKNCIPNILVWACCSILCLLLSFISLTLWMAKLDFDVFMIVAKNYIHHRIKNLQSIVVALYCEDKMTSLSWSSFSSKIQAMLTHNFFMKDIDLSLSLP